MNTTLHAAIERVIKEKGFSMTAKEIALEINNNSLYIKEDKSPVKPGQITARVNKYPMNFIVDRTDKPLKIDLP